MARSRMGALLVDAGVLTLDQLKASSDKLRKGSNRSNLISVIAESGYATEEQIARAFAQQLNLPYVELGTAVADPDLIQSVPRQIAIRHQLVPIGRIQNGIVIAMADPTNVLAIDDVRTASDVGKVNLAVATMSGIKDAVDRLYSVDVVANDMLNRLGVASEIEVESEERPSETADELTALESAAHMGPIVRLVNAMFADAVRSRATDIHIEPQPTELKVRYRVDGLLREVMTLPKNIQALVVSRLKILSNLDIAERRKPQDGRSRFLVEGNNIDARVSTIPTMAGEKVVIRLLPKDQEAKSMTDLGLEETEMRILKQNLDTPQGFICFTGPTGSGKTSTMYASLKYLHTPEKNMITLEDPIEYELVGLNQVQIDEKAGITFARGLRSILRQDPDVIMVGEIRDLETAQIVMQASLTGHLVLSSLHTNDAPSAVTRLVDIGVEPFLIASALSLVVAQRLVRVVCTHCAEVTEPPDRTMMLLELTAADLADAKLVKGAGCDRCNYTGYRGRTGIYEILPITGPIRQQIGAQVSETAIAQMARNAGVKGLREMGLRKAVAGITTLDEVLRVTFTEREELPRCPNCRHQVNYSFVICPYCQAELLSNMCPSCHREVHADWQACPYCRTDLPTHEPEKRDGRLRVLTIDDDASVRGAVRTLRADIYEVIAAATGEEGLRRATLERPDLILLDLGLQDMPASDIVRRLREHTSTSLIPLVLIGEPSEAQASGLLREGIDENLPKPVDIEALRVRVTQALDRSLKGAHSSSGAPVAS
ncbi:MAG TPA: ATPase, T2SS/T4P/T4SS family [Actinomycetota bacterium]|nr:ATPase, T2SS/T4P/T4SS family [Actinomycetota bacterium]